MPRADINDRTSLERIYPPDAFAADATQNGRPAESLRKGVRISTGPDAHGGFDIERASLGIGEQPGAVFLAPFHREHATDKAADDPDPRRDYEAFIDDIIVAANKLGFQAESSPGPGDRRLRGLRQ